MKNLKYFPVKWKQSNKVPSYKAKLLYGLLLIPLFLCVSCKKLVDIDPPNRSLSTSNVFTTDQSAIAAQLNVYAILSNNYSYYCQYTGLSSDELISYASAGLNLDLYQNNLNAQGDGGIANNWAYFFNIIYAENAIIENVDRSTTMSDRVKSLTIGEAKFTRAFIYFELVNMFGDVPLVLTTDYTKNSTLPRSPASAVYQQIVTDLQAAQSSLSSGYLDALDNTNASDKVRPTVWAADALLARVYLYLGKYELAEQQANLVIANSSYSLSPLSGSGSVFNMNSSESIWQVMQPSAEYSTATGKLFILRVPPNSGGGNSNAISPQLYNAFESHDARKTNWIGTLVDGGNTYYFPYKYKDDATATSTTEYTMILRLAEQYLIRAEARAQQGKVTGANSAASDLNEIRTRAGLPNTTAASRSAMLDAIAHERQVELFTENDRWFDLKRTKTIDGVMSVVTPQKGSSWNSYQQLYPLPVNDLQNDPNLVQNPGY